MSEKNNEQKQEAGACGPGCSCGTSGAGSRMKWVICGVVALVAIGVVAVRLSSTRAMDGQAGKRDYASAIQTTAAVKSVTPALAEDSSSWGIPLKALAELDQLAADTEAVFIVLPSSDASRMAAIQKEVSTAAATINSRGIRMGKFVLSQDSQDYEGIVKQMGAPAVLAMCKGRGMAAVPGNEVTQDSLLRAYVGASRPSGCGSSCGPSASGCN